MTDAEMTAILEPAMHELFGYLEMIGAVAIMPDTRVIPLRTVTLDELAAAVRAAGLPPPRAGMARLHEVLFGAPPDAPVEIVQ